jgi:hypothetical protein
VHARSREVEGFGSEGSSDKQDLPPVVRGVSFGRYDRILVCSYSIRPDWVEAVSGWDPDQHRGSVEWMGVMALLAGTLALLDRFRS